VITGIEDGPGDGRCASSRCAERYVAEFQSVLGANARRIEQRVTLAGAPRRLVRIDGVGPQGDRLRLLMAVIDRPEGHRFLNCFGNPEYEKRCRPAFDAMADLPWRADVPVPLRRAR
jgi:hypothetical protein